MGRGLSGHGNPPGATDRSRAPRDNSRLGRSGPPKEAQHRKEALPARASWQLRHAQKKKVCMGMGKGKVFKHIDKSVFSRDLKKRSGKKYT